MQQEYPVFSGDEEIGKVFVKHQGLYYCICCRCALTGSVRYKLLAECGENRVDLGIWYAEQIKAWQAKGMTLREIAAELQKYGCVTTAQNLSRFLKKK